jgi:chromosomal replication initiator protein
MTDLDYEGFWKETLVQLRNILGEEEFSGWFLDIKYLRCSTTDAGKANIIVGIPSAFHRDKVNSHYKEQIISILKKVSGQEIDFEMEVTGKTAKKDETHHDQQKNEKYTSVITEKTQKVKEKRGQHPQMRDDYTFERYVVGDNNKFAANAAHAISKNPGKAYNPFLIFGGVGLGKTHLMQAIGNYIHENTDNRVICITSENFLNEYLDGLREEKMSDFKNKYRETDVLLIDDIQFFTDKPGVQEELFHTFNSLLNAKKQIIFTCDRPVEELKKFPERITARFKQGLKADLQPPRYEERCVILKSVAQTRGVVFPDEVIDLISKSISSNIRELISALNNLIAYSELMGKPITLEIAQKHLKNIFNDIRPANLSMDSIIRVTSEYFGLTPNDLKGKKRSQNIVFARQLAMYIGREMTEFSTTEMGQDFGGKDHTTVMYSIEKIRSKLITDPTLEATIEGIKRAIKEFSAKY